MKREICINGKYLNIPVAPGAPEKLISIYQTTEDGTQVEKIMEYLIPIDEEAKVYKGKYITQIPMDAYQGSTLEFSGDMTEAFCEAITSGDDLITMADKEKRPSIHFTADTGWTNDPNGMVFDGEKYHLYYQYNPFNLAWNNMSWGHAVSKDLLHWEQKDAVMFPDADGPIYSGCAIMNERGLLGLPKDAIIFFYTAAGGVGEWSKDLEFTQKIAYSLDGGETLTKIADPCVPVLYKDSRDPKVFWHEETQAYIMVLWTKGNDFAVLRSENLKDWELTHEFELEDGWECPDLLQLKSEEGETCWFFWSADGYYYIGEFDGYHFNTDGLKHRAYLSSIPYAAQTYSGVDGRVISIPWLRIENDGRCFTSSYGIPVEFSCKKVDGEWILLQKPVKELMEHVHPVSHMLDMDEPGVIHVEDKEYKNAYIIRARMDKDTNTSLNWRFNGSTVQYIPDAGRLKINNKAYRVYKNQKDLLFIVDDRILEVFFIEEGQLGTFDLRKQDASFDLRVSEVAGYEVYIVD